MRDNVGTETTALTRRSLLKGAGAFGIGGLLASLTPELAGAQIDTTNRPVIVADLSLLSRSRSIPEQLAQLAPRTNQAKNRAILVVFGQGQTYAFTDTSPMEGRYSAFITLDDTRYIMDDVFRGIYSFVGGVFESRQPLGQITTAINVTMRHQNPATAWNEVAFLGNGLYDDGPNFTAEPTLISGCTIDGYPYGADVYSNSTVRDCTVANIAGGVFVRADGDNIVIENNRSSLDAPLLYPGTIGAHIIVSLAGTNHIIRNNNFVGDPVAWRPEVTNGATGDMIAVKRTTGFRIDNNTLQNSGEYGIVISHGSADGIITRNSIYGTDGCSIVIGVDDVLDDGGGSTRARVHNISVTDNHITDCGLDRAGDLGRSRATPNNTVLWNYPNSLAGIRVTNADGVTIRRNSINQYRSSGIWVSNTTGEEAARALSEVTNLVLDDTNALHPFGGPAFDDENWQALSDHDHAPWSGTSKQVDETGQPSGATVFGLNVSRIIGFDDPQRNLLGTLLATEEVRVILTCLGGRGRIDVHLFNKSTADTATYSVTVGGLRPRTKELAPVEAGRVTVTGRPNGPIRVTVLRDDEEIYQDVHLVECEGTAPGP